MYLETLLSVDIVSQKNFLVILVFENNVRILFSLA